jgi:hypothetical protein
LCSNIASCIAHIFGADVDVLVQDSKATQMKASHKGFLSSSVSIDTKATATNIESICQVVNTI